MDFENGHRLAVMTSTALVGKAPAKFNWAWFYSTFEQRVLTPRELAIHIWRGHSFTPVWKESRKEGNFVSATHLAFDFDAGDETSSLDYLMRDGTFAWMFASFGYTTPSHTPESPRARLVFVLDFPIFDAQEYRELYQAVAWYIAQDGSQTDPACKDPLRLYYGSKDCRVWPNWSVLAAPSIRVVLDAYREAHPVVKTTPLAPVKRIDTNPSEGLKEHKRRAIVTAVRNAPPGERHTTLLKQSRLAGGFVASGVFNEAAIMADLLAAAGDFGDGENGRREAERVVRDGLRYGQGSPVYFERTWGIGEMLP